MTASTTLKLLAGGALLAFMYRNFQRNNKDKSVVVKRKKTRREQDPSKPQKEVPDREDVRAFRPASRGLLLLYPIEHEDNSKHYLVSAGVSFPNSPHAPALTYTVNETWARQYGVEIEPDEPT